jgi:hypothetical protein
MKSYHALFNATVSPLNCLANPHSTSIESIISGSTESNVDKVGNISFTLELDGSEGGEFAILYQ